MKKFGLGLQFSNGIVFGVRHYEPDDECKYYEIQIFLGLFVVAIMIW